MAADPLKGNSSSGLRTGDQIGPYVNVDTLGTGGMGEVYRARDARLERDVAIKRLSSSAIGGAEARARVLREARAAAALTHPNIVKILDTEPIDIYVNPTFLPDVIAAEYDALWTPERMDRVIAAAARNAEIAVVFFAGHGVEIAGENWLLPIDAELAFDTAVQQEAISHGKDIGEANPFGQGQRLGSPPRIQFSFRKDFGKRSLRGHRKWLDRIGQSLPPVVEGRLNQACENWGTLCRPVGRMKVQAD